MNSPPTVHFFSLFQKILQATVEMTMPNEVTVPGFHAVKSLRGSGTGKKGLTSMLTLSRNHLLLFPFHLPILLL